MRLLGPGHGRALAVPSGRAVIALTDHPVLLSYRLNIGFPAVDLGADRGDSLRDPLEFRVGHFPGRIKVRQVGVDHLDRGDVVHLHAVFPGEVLHEFRENRAVGAICTDSEEIVGLELGAGDEILDDGRGNEAIDRADEADFFRFIDWVLVVDFLRNAQQGRILSTDLPSDIQAVPCRGEEEQQTLGLLSFFRGFPERGKGWNAAGEHAKAHDFEGFPAVDGVIDDVHGMINYFTLFSLQK